MAKNGFFQVDKDNGKDEKEDTDEEEDEKEEERELSLRKQSASSSAPLLEGGWGWVVVFGSFVLHVIADGVVYSFGVLVPSFLESFPDASRANVGGIGSLMIGVTWGSGPIASILVEKYGYRSVIIAGSLISSAGFFATIFVPSVWFMYLTFGIAAGLGLGFIYLPAVVAISFYFDRKRALATGIAVSGAGIGTFIFAPVTQLLLDLYGWKGAVLIDSGILLNCIACGMLFRQDERVKLLCAPTPQSSPQPPPPPQPPSCEHEASSNSKEHKPVENKAEEPSQSSRKPCGRFSELNLIKEPVCIMFCVSNLLSCLGYCVPYIFLTDLSLSLGAGAKESAFLVSIIGISNTVARILFGFISDFKCVNRFLFYNMNLTLCGLVSLAGVYFTVYPLLICYAIVFGVCMGVYTCLVPVVLVDLFGLKKLAFTFGLVLFFQGIGAVAGPPIAGRMFDVSGSYGGSFLFMGTAMTLGGALMYIVPCFKRCRHRNRNKHNKRSKPENGTIENG